VLRGLGFDLAFGSFESLHQEIFQIPPAAIGSEKTQIVDVKISPYVSVSEFLPIYFIQPVLLCDAFNDMVVETLKRITHI
jgi:hypothetical protein